MPSMGRIHRALADHVDMGGVAGGGEFPLGKLEMEQFAVVDQEFGVGPAEDAGQMGRGQPEFAAAGDFA